MPMLMSGFPNGRQFWKFAKQFGKYDHVRRRKIDFPGFPKLSWIGPFKPQNRHLHSSLENYSFNSIYYHFWLISWFRNGKSYINNYRVLNLNLADLCVISWFYTYLRKFDLCTNVIKTKIHVRYNEKNLESWKMKKN